MTERNVSLTIKAGPGYEVPWITLTGDSVADVDGLLDHLHASALLGKAVHLSAMFRSAHIEKQREAGERAQPQEQPPAQQGYQNQPNPIPQQPQQGWQQPAVAVPGPPGAPFCRCGQQTQFKGGIGPQKKGAWRCPSWRFNNGNPTPDHDQIWID